MEKYIALNCKQKKSQNKKMKYNKTKKILLMSIIVCAIMLIFPQPAAAAFKYVLLEAFPGFFNKGASPDLPEMVLAIYKFGIWTVGICGLLMMTVGGVMYMGSAGNNAAAESAKKIISDSLLGIIVALGAYLFLYVINPDLVYIDINFAKAELTENIEGTPMGTIDSTTGKYKKITSGKCTVENLTALNKTNTPSTWATQASCICSGESGGVDNALSSVDKCQGGGTNDSVSIGLFQINLSVHKIAGLNCPSAFNTAYTAKIAKDKTKCWVTDRELYNKCVKAASNPDTNISAAWNIYSQKSNWKQWGARKGCGL